MKIKLISHASVVINCSDVRIWTDPWLHGKAFNESWALEPPAEFDPAWLADYEYLWLSHEHPDHFHVPTLKSLPADFKERVTLLFQENNSEKMFDALRKLGFRNFVKLPHRKIVPLTDKTSVYCCQVGNMDSALGVINEGKTILNLNDCEANTRDCLLLRKDLGAIDVVLNQFSMAGNSGEEDHEYHLRNAAQTILKNVSENHRDLGAKVTIPMASFIYFCTEDNRYMNEYANTVDDVCAYLEQHQQECVVLYPGDTYEVGSAYDSQPARQRYRECNARAAERTYDAGPVIPLTEIESAFHTRVAHFRKSYPRSVLKLLKPVGVRIPDLNTDVRFCVANDEFTVVGDVQRPDLTIRSQPLFFVFRWPYGLQTLGVSARLILHENAANWRRHRILFSLDNAELYLRPRLFFTLKNMKWLCKRLPGGFNQLRYQLQRMSSKPPSS